MKNLHLIPTDKPSLIAKGEVDNLLAYNKFNPFNSKHWSNQNIYITSDEEIKFDEYYLGDDDNIYCLVSSVNRNGKKIILTTDQDLIKDGVQEIDDEFLEWFVKNPSCEYVGIEPDYDEVRGDYYKIIIPKEEHKQTVQEYEQQGLQKHSYELEPKQETLEEAAREYIKGDDLSTFSQRAFFIAGAKWQAERMYSEEEVYNLLCKLPNYFKMTIPQQAEARKEWFEKFTQNWVGVDDCNIDFSKHEPTRIGDSLHVTEKQYNIDGTIYRVRSVIDSEIPLIQKLDI